MGFYLISALVGLLGGITSGLLGVGGGIVMVPAMVYLLKTDLKLAIGTSLAIIVPTAISGAMKHYGESNVDWRLFLSIAPMAIIGGYIGAHVVSEVPEAVLRKIFGIFLLFVAVKMLLK